MDNIFEITDKTERKIRLTKKIWSHLAKHPNVIDKLEDIKETLQKPLKISDYAIEDDIKYYYKYYKERKHGKYLRIIVKYLNGDGYIITAYFVENIK